VGAATPVTPTPPTPVITTTDLATAFATELDHESAAVARLCQFAREKAF
jgi:hypothetical protein